MEEERYFSYAYPTCCALEDSAHSSAISTLSLEVTKEYWKYRQVKKKIHDLTDIAYILTLYLTSETCLAIQVTSYSTFCYANDVTLLALWHHLTPLLHYSSESHPLHKCTTLIVSYSLCPVQWVTA